MPLNLTTSSSSKVDESIDTPDKSTVTAAGAAVSVASSTLGFEQAVARSATDMTTAPKPLYRDVRGQLPVFIDSPPLRSTWDDCSSATTYRSIALGSVLRLWHPQTTIM
jgi:hypothetical protein